jgi:predicted ABC-type exoprotein transport system permease subunit
MKAALGFRFDLVFVAMPLYWLSPGEMQQKTAVFLKLFSFAVWGQSVGWKGDSQHHF